MSSSPPAHHTVTLTVCLSSPTCKTRTIQSSSVSCFFKLIGLSSLDDEVLITSYLCRSGAKEPQIRGFIRTSEGLQQQVILLIRLQPIRAASRKRKTDSSAPFFSRDEKAARIRLQTRFPAVLLSLGLPSEVLLAE